MGKMIFRTFFAGILLQQRRNLVIADMITHKILFYQEGSQVINMRKVTLFVRIV
jgi:hypothetical protein